MKTIQLYVSGTHCRSCKILIEDTINRQKGIQDVYVNLKQETVSFETNLEHSGQKFAEMLTEKMKQNGYMFSLEKKLKEKKNNTIIWQALPIGIFFLALFFLFQKSGILNFGIDGTVTPITSFIIGLIASVSSCLAIVGGLVLSLSATVSKSTVQNTKPMFLFHGGRLIGFAFLGGILGGLGSVIGVSFTLGALLGIIASVVMLVLGLNLVGFFEKNIFTLPSGIFAFFQKIKHQIIAPFLLGVGTFFLPCGFTQSMQITALSSGSFFEGMFIMLAFAFGTLPVLALLSFGSASFTYSKHAPLFFKSAGIVVIGLGIFSLLSALASLGIIDPLFVV